MTNQEAYTKTQQLYPWLTSIERNLHEMDDTRFIHLAYVRETEHSVKRYSSFQQQYFGILTGEEFIYVTDDVTGDLLYAVNVTGDAILTAVWELMGLLSKKF